MILIGLDLGSAHTGAVVAVDGRPTHASTVGVDAADVGPAAAELWGIIRGSGAEVVAVEWGELHPGATPQATAAMGRAHETMAITLDRLSQRCVESSIAVVKIHVQTVRARIGVRWPKGEARTAALVDRLVREALAATMGEEALVLADVHQRDAAAVALALHIGEKASVPRRPRGIAPSTYVRKLGTRRQGRGHPSDAAFERLMASRGVVE